MFIAAQFTRAKIWKQPKCPSADEWIRKLVKKEGIRIMDGPGEHYAKQNKTVR